MADPAAQPPSYASLFQSESPPIQGQLHPQNPPTEGYPQQESINPSASPAHPGSYPQNHSSNASPYPHPQIYPGGPGAPVGGYPHTTGAAERDSHDPRFQATQFDPLLNPPFPLAPTVTSPDRIQVQITEPQPEIPCNPRAPANCILGSMADYNVQMAPGQEQPGEEKEGTSTTKFLWAVLSIIAHVCFLVCVIILVVQVPMKQEYDAWWSTVGKDERTRGSGQFGYSQAALICASVFLVICYFVAIVEGCTAGTSDYVQEEEKLADFRSYINNVRKQVPTVVLKAEAFHQGKERIEWNNGVMTSRRNSDTTQKCVTFQEKVVFPFSKCVDVTETLDTFNQGQLYRVEYGKTFGFLDEATTVEYRRLKQQLIARVSGLDAEHSVEETLVLTHTKKKTVVYIDEHEGRPFYISFVFYCMLACCMCSWPYRLFFTLLTKKKKYSFVKLIGI